MCVCMDEIQLEQGRQKKPAKMCFFKPKSCLSVLEWEKYIDRHRDYITGVFFNWEILYFEHGRLKNRQMTKST